MLSSTMSYYEQRRINTNLISNLWAREFGAIDRLKFHRQLQGSANLIDRLDQSGLLVGHEGCVNCLEWSSDGRILASGSDDFHVMLWDPFRKKSISRLRTNHMGNLFSVKFLPQHCNTKIATGAADKYIYVFDINQHNEPLLYCNCHTMRVKRLATAPDEANIFWSAAEDGSVLQLDIREKHVCRSKENRYRLINLSTYLNTHAEIKCIAINPRRTEYIAVGSNDPYARIYDRRMLRMTSTFVPEGANRDEIGEARQPCMPKGCVTYYCPGHISHNNPRVIDHESRAITYLTYNAAGTELLVNMGGEHVYLYDLLNAEHPTFLNLPDYKPPTTPTPDIEMPEADADATTQTAAAGDATAETKAASSINASTAAASASAATKRPKLPDHIEALKKLGNDFLENEKYLRAIEKYSEAIALAPQCAVLYLNRATAYMRRLWFGDVYAALRDCHQALNLDPSYIKAHFRLARALLELGRPSDADSCLKELIARFSSYADNHGILMLAKDIRENPPSSTQQTNNRTADPNSPMGYYYNEMITEISTDEHEMRSKAKDYEQRFVGHCNTKTDIKEANYFGYNGDYIVAGSDDGNFYLWERKTCMIHSVYRADSAIVNCVQPHPEICMMATSGIDREIRLWEPIAEEGEERTSSVIANKDKWVEDNQQKMKTDPFDLNSRNAYCLSS